MATVHVYSDIFGIDEKKKQIVHGAYAIRRSGHHVPLHVCVRVER